MGNDEGLTPERLHRFVQEARDIDTYLDTVSRVSSRRHLRDAAEEAKGFAEDLERQLRGVRHALRREARPVDEKIQHLEDTLEELLDRLGTPADA